MVLYAFSPLCVLNTMNGLTDIAIGTLNFGMTMACPLGAILGLIPKIPTADWSNGLLTVEDPTSHEWSKWLGGNGVVLLVSAYSFLATAPVRGAFAGLIDGHAAGQGFTGVFDSVTGQVLLRPSRVFAAGESIPAGWVARQGGHNAVSTLLGGSRANHLGYAVIIQADGTLAITWSSGVLNGGLGLKQANILAI